MKKSMRHSTLLIICGLSLSLILSPLAARESGPTDEEIINKTPVLFRGTLIKTELVDRPSNDAYFYADKKVLKLTYAVNTKWKGTQNNGVSVFTLQPSSRNCPDWIPTKRLLEEIGAVHIVFASFEQSGKLLISPSCVTGSGGDIIKSDTESGRHWNEAIPRTLKNPPATPARP